MTAASAKSLTRIGVDAESWWLGLKEQMAAMLRDAGR